MTVYDIGQYRVQQLNQGFKVSWDDKQGCRQHMMMDIEKVIQDHINGHLDNLLHVLVLFDRGPDAVLDYDVGERVLQSIPYTETVPGYHIPSHLIREWHHRQLVTGYNRAFGTSLTYEMIRNRL